jgi:hypothetical protein
MSDERMEEMFEESGSQRVRGGVSEPPAWDEYLRRIEYLSCRMAVMFTFLTSEQKDEFHKHVEELDRRERERLGR